MGWWGAVVVAVSMLTALRARGDDALILRARGFVRGRSEIAPDRIRCEVPTTAAAVPDVAFVLGLFATAGVPTLTFPDPQNPYADPCGGWLRVESRLVAQGVQLDRVDLRYRLGGGALRGAVPLQRGFPRACGRLRRARLVVGLRLDAALPDQAGAGATGFLPVLPMVSPGLIRCLQGALAGAPFGSVPLLIRARATGVADTGARLTSNAAGYTLTLVAGDPPLLVPSPSG